VNRSDRGFTLLEVMIALAILGLAVAAVFDLMKVGLLSTEASAGYSRAVLHGHAKMGELLAILPIEAGGTSGSFEDGFTYETHVQLFELPGLSQSTGANPDLAAGPGAEVYLLEVVIGMPNQERKLRLQTLRSVPLAQSQVPQ
jgi:general secretion pathway protein I